MTISRQNMNGLPMGADRARADSGGSHLLTI